MDKKYGLVRIRMKSIVKGVRWLPDREVWLSLTNGKRTLYRGKDQQEAENERLKWDLNKPAIQPQAKARSHTDMFKNVVTAYWPATIDTFEGCDIR